MFLGVMASGDLWDELATLEGQPVALGWLVCDIESKQSAQVQFIPGEPLAPVVLLLEVPGVIVPQLLPLDSVEKGAYITGGEKWFLTVFLDGGVIYPPEGTC